MDILFLLIPLSVVLVFCIIYFLAWAVGKGQFEKLDKHGAAILEDSEKPQT